MSSAEVLNSSDNENLCVVCFKNVEIYSIGVCDHPVCFECSTRMRVLCRQNECPICRQDMPKVIFTKKIEPFSILFPQFERSNLQDRRFGVYFCISDIQKAYNKILEHRCQVCEETERKWPFKTFQQLKDHMRREHELFYCDICIDNLKIFTFERRCYTRQELGHHRRKGDPDNTSHRLIIRGYHFNPHITTEHSRYMSKSATKQARTLELEFTLAPRPSENLRNKRYNDRRFDEEGSQGGCNMEPGGPGGGNEGTSRMFVNPLTSQDFPALGNTSSSITLQSRPTTTVNFMSKMNSNFSGADFPSLDHKAPKVSIHVNHKPNGSITTHITTSASSSTQQRPTEAFPALGNTTSIVQPQWVLAKSRKQESKNLKVAPAPQLPPSNMDQFPTLAKKKSSVTVPVSNSWVNLNNINSNNSRGFNSTGSGDNNNRKVSDVKPSSSKQRQPTVENKLQDLKISETSETKSKNKKKKNKTILELESNKQTKSARVLENSKTNEPKPNKPVEISKRYDVKTINNATSSDSANNNENNLRNGLIKKRSELQIGTLTNTGESSNISSDFPALGETKPPPGFNVKPPPGFTPASFPSLGVSNDLTFTSSSGQSYAITPSNNYHQPSNFQSRNQNLIKRFMAVLHNNDAIKEFKNFSVLFRNGLLPASKYYSHCQEVLGSTFEEVFPELLVLLPDINKQQELYNAYEGKNKKNMVICENCKQVIFRRELTDHYNYHSLDNHFPSLGKVQQVNNIWKK
ncbi:hypothetical protein NQ314_019087 [Rhamnusium bicolor]|uniref:RING-type domain-containing protein n=1 Tax=Rhamnusium bicolor TaxID=1586634 RepID=A0AAV8WQC3_9CUCU|nr:hypothetical protein NQ314_019087 [Rhamnusium bicolor]